MEWLRPVDSGGKLAFFCICGATGLYMQGVSVRSVSCILLGWPQRTVVIRPMDFCFKNFR
ncbi:hypothetical protein D5274_01950 [bacterium 1XD42-94]|nr:hypothetical protein [bacterium 1XD42-76]NBK03958.1 hypothetical protein [bacterium 1XD42-94]